MIHKYYMIYLLSFQNIRDKMRITIDEKNNVIKILEFPKDLYNWENVVKLLNILREDFYIAIDGNKEKIDIIFKSKEDMNIKDAKEFVNEFFKILIGFEQSKVALDKEISLDELKNV